MKLDIEQLCDEEQDYLDSIPENLQGGERYEKSEEAVSALEGAVDCLDEAIDNIDIAIE